MTMSVLELKVTLYPIYLTVLKLKVTLYPIYLTVLKLKATLYPIYSSVLKLKVVAHSLLISNTCCMQQLTTVVYFASVSVATATYLILNIKSIQYHTR